MLGPLEIVADGRTLPLKAAKQKTILALLLLHRDEVVSVDQLQEALWAERPPATATTALQGYVSQLRRLLEGGEEGGASLLVTRSPGYALAAAPEQLDLARFEQLAESGREALAGGEPARAATLLAEALALWRGPPLADFGYEAWAQAAIGRLEELRLSVLEDRIEADLACGRHGELVGELESLIAEQPLRERLHGQLMLALYRAGRQADALEAYHAARRALVEELGIEPSPELQSLNHSILNQDEALAAPRRSPARGPIELPVPATPLVGREQELQELAERLTTTTARLLTVTGPGGIGKTRVAVELARRVADAYPDGVWFVDLSALRDPALVLPTVQQAVAPNEVLASRLAGRRSLLVLDNFEHVIDAAGGVGALVGACPRLTVLVTSRERLQVAGEHEYPVPTMASPDGLELFIARARALGGEINGDSATEELCERLDNLPLALELAAARTKMFSPAQLLERLGRRLDLFRGGRDADPRQRTLRATVEWSHDLLGPEEQRLFAHLSVFAGGCGYDAAEEICGADEDTLQSLLDRSLLRSRDGPVGELRYWMLETIRQFAAERLHELDQGEAIGRRHAEWYADLAERLQEPMRDGDPEATARLEAEVDNLRGALQLLADEGDAREGLKIVWGLWYFWVTRGFVAEGLRWADWAIGAAPQAPPDEGAFGLLAASELHRNFGVGDLALRIKRELVAHFRAHGPENRVASTLADMAEMHAFEGEFAEARRLSDEAITLRRRLGTPWGIAHALGNRGMVEFWAGDFQRARELHEEAITFVEEPYLPTSLAAAVMMAGESARRTGDLVGAVPLLRRALHLHEGLGHRAAFPELLQEIAAASTGPPAAAVRLLGASERLLTEMEVPRWDQADYEQTVANLRAQLGDEAFEEAWTAGAALTEDEALSLAASCLD